MAGRKRLRKQPKLRRMKATGSAALPKIVVPPAAKKRRKRNRASLRAPVRSLIPILTSARWISLGLLAVCVWALLTIGRDETFFLTEIPVEGAISMPVSEIVAGSGLYGRHIFAADPNEAAARIGQIPGIVSATVTLDWPNMVSIQITEDSPIAVWQQAGQKFWINAEGELEPMRAEINGLLLIESEEGESVGEQTFISEDVLLGALQLRELRPNIDRLYYQPGNGLSYQDGRGWRTYFGTGLEMEQKLVVYETIVEDLLGRAITPAYISVRNQAKPYYTTNGG